MAKTLFLGSIAMFGVLATSCIGRIEGALDCSEACVTYSECVDKDYDIDACSTRCEDSMQRDVTFPEKADACDLCVASMACSEDEFACADECRGVVP